MTLPCIDYTKDVATLEEIELFLTICSDQYTPPLSSYIDIYEYSLKLSQFAIKYEAWSHKKLVGLLAAYFNQSNASAFITNLNVIADFSKTGVASNLIHIFEDELARHKVSAIKLEVHENNIKAIQFYKKHLFKIENQDKGKLLMSKSIK